MIIRIMSRRHIILDVEAKGLTREKAHSITYKGSLKAIQPHMENESNQVSKPVEIMTQSFAPVVVPTEITLAPTSVEVVTAAPEVKAVEIVPEPKIIEKPIVPEKKKGGFQKKIKDPDPTSGVPQAE